MAEDAQQERKAPLEGVKGGPVGYGNPPKAHCIPPGTTLNPGGRKRGASIVHELERRLAKGAQFDEAGELVQAGTEACKIADALISVSAGDRDPSEVDVKAALAIMERVDGAVVKERVQTNIEVLQDVELRDRRERPAPGTETK